MDAFADQWSPAEPVVLVVDPDTDTRALYRCAFEGAGFHIVEASDGRDALAKALIRPPTLVVTEIVVPFLDGCALCEILRRDRTTADVPIVVVTAEGRPVKLDRARRAGADAVFVKPVAVEPLLVEARRLADGGLRVQAGAAGRDRFPPRDGSAAPSGGSDEPVRKVLSQSISRFGTTAPPASPPSLLCPTCDRPLTYRRSEIGGVSDRHSEQWDYYVCPGMCGEFQYRQRTRKVRRVS
jgi:CheY-like chemotaxis protein